MEDGDLLHGSQEGKVGWGGVGDDIAELNLTFASLSYLHYSDL